MTKCFTVYFDKPCKAIVQAGLVNYKVADLMAGYVRMLVTVDEKIKNGLEYVDEIHTGSTST